MEEREALSSPFLSPSLPVPAHQLHIQVPAAGDLALVVEVVVAVLLGCNKQSDKGREARSQQGGECQSLYFRAAGQKGGGACAGSAEGGATSGCRSNGLQEQMCSRRANICRRYRGKEEANQPTP